jgi:hypothetical protein
VHTEHVPAEAALALELLEADVAVKLGLVMFGLDVHVTAAGRAELLGAELAWVQLPHTMNGVYVPGNI